MKLTDHDRRMLDGHEGAARQKAMEFIVRYACVAGAEDLCTVTWADLFCGWHSYLKVAGTLDIDRILSTMALCSPERVRLEAMAPGCVCYSGVEADCTEVPGAMLMNSRDRLQNRAMLERMVDAGVILSGNCIPYLTGFIPLMGEHFVSCESSAVLFMNSLWGACGNGDGIEASFCAAVCGRTPRFGMHLPENRVGTVEVRVRTFPQSIHDWDLLGYAVGRKLPAHAVPVLTGGGLRPGTLELKAFFAALACAAGTEMCHIPGITPQAPDKAAAFQGTGPCETIDIRSNDLTDSLKSLNEYRSGTIDYISLGCPHYHIEEIRQVAGFLAGKKVHPDTRLDIWTTGPMRYMAERCGYLEVIETAGARLLTGSCPSSRGYAPGIRTVAYDSAKQRLSAAQETDAQLFYGSRYQCLESALSGRWEGAS